MCVGLAVYLALESSADIGWDDQDSVGQFITPGYCLGQVTHSTTISSVDTLKVEPDPYQKSKRRCKFKLVFWTSKMNFLVNKVQYLFSYVYKYMQLGALCPRVHQYSTFGKR